MVGEWARKKVRGGFEDRIYHNKFYKLCQKVVVAVADQLHDCRHLLHGLVLHHHAYGERWYDHHFQNEAFCCDDP